MAMEKHMYKAQEVVKTCNKHEHKKLLYFCRDCKKFICLCCGKNEHIFHDWDDIASIAKARRKETPKYCHKIKTEIISQLKEKICERITSIQMNREKDITEMEKMRTTMVDMVNRKVDELKEKRDELAQSENEEEKMCLELKKKLDYIEKIKTCLDRYNAEYNDFDLLEMINTVMAALADVESYKVDTTASTVAFVPGTINEELIMGLIGRIEETPKNLNQSPSVCEIKTISEFKGRISTIAPSSDTKAWVSGFRNTEIKLLSSQSKVIHFDTGFNMYVYDCREISSIDFVLLPNGEFIVKQFAVLLRVTSAGKESVIASTKPLYLLRINNTQTDDIFVSLMDDGDFYQLQPSSRRLVQRMTLTGKVLRTYEFHEDGTRLFTLPLSATENGNSDIFVINGISSDTGELIILRGDGRMRATYGGQEGSEFDPRDVACDCNKRIIVLDCTNRSLHLLSPDGTFLRYLLSDMFDYPMVMAIYQGSMWIGFQEGAVTVYKYSE